MELYKRHTPLVGITSSARSSINNSVNVSRAATSVPPHLRAELPRSMKFVQERDSTPQKRLGITDADWAYKKRLIRFSLLSNSPTDNLKISDNLYGSQNSTYLNQPSATPTLTSRVPIVLQSMNHQMVRAGYKEGMALPKLTIMQRTRQVQNVYMQPSLNSMQSTRKVMETEERRANSRRNASVQRTFQSRADTAERLMKETRDH